MSTNLTFKNIIGFKIKKEYWAELPKEEREKLKDLENLELVYFNSMGDSDVVLGQVLFSFTDSFPNAENLTNNCDIHLFLLIANSVFFSIDNAKLSEKISGILTKEQIKLYTIVDYS